MKFLVDGYWLSPLYAPPGWIADPEQALEGQGWTMTMALEFHHPEHGIVWAVPGHLLMRRA